MTSLPAFDEEGKHGFKAKRRLKMGEKYVNFFKNEKVEMSGKRFE